MTTARLYYLDDIPTPYRLGVQKLVAERWPGEFRLAYCAASEPGRDWELDFGALRPEFLEGRQWRPSHQMNPFSFKWNPGVGRSLSAFRPDVVVLSGYAHPTMWQAARWCIRNGVPYAITCETSARISRTAGWRWAAKRLIAGWIVRNMAFGLPVGREAAAYLRRLAPTDAPMYFFPNTPDTGPIIAEANRIAATGGEAALRRELGISADAAILLFVGRIIDAKRPLDAIEAFMRLGHAPEAMLLIVGDGDNLAGLSQRVAGDPRIVLTGWIKDPAKIVGLMAISTALLLPSEHEPWGAVVNEAMAAGTPVISSDRVGAAIELVESGKNGFLVPVGNVEALADAMRKVVADRDLAFCMGAAARCTALQQGEEFAVTNFVTGALESIRNGAAFAEANLTKGASATARR